MLNRFVGGWWPTHRGQVPPAATPSKPEETREQTLEKRLMQFVELEDRQEILALFDSGEQLPWGRALLLAVSRKKHTSVDALLKCNGIEMKALIGAVEVAVDCNDSQSLQACLKFFSQKCTVSTLESLLERAARQADWRCLQILLQFSSERQRLSSAFLGTVLSKIVSTGTTEMLQYVLQFSILHNTYIQQNEGLERALVALAKEDKREQLQVLLEYANTSRCYIPLDNKILARVLLVVAEKSNVEALKKVLEHSSQTRVLIPWDEGLAKAIEFSYLFPENLTTLLEYVQQENIVVQGAFLGHMISLVVQAGCFNGLRSLLSFSEETTTWISQKEGLAEAFHFALAGKPGCLRALCVYVSNNQNEIDLEVELFREMIRNLICRAKDPALCIQALKDLGKVLELATEVGARVGEEFLITTLQAAVLDCPESVYTLTTYTVEYGKLILNGRAVVTLSPEMLDSAMQNLVPLTDSHKTAQTALEALRCVMLLSLNTKVYLKKEEMAKWLNDVSCAHLECVNLFLKYACDCVKSSCKESYAAEINGDLFYQMILNLLPLITVSDTKEQFALEVFRCVLRFASNTKIEISPTNISAVLRQAQERPHALSLLLNYTQVLGIPVEEEVVEEIYNHVLEGKDRQSYVECKKILDTPWWQDRLPKEVHSLGAEGQFCGVEKKIS